jgi:hypothetical protein
MVQFAAEQGTEMLEAVRGLFDAAYADRQMRDTAAEFEDSCRFRAAIAGRIEASPEHPAAALRTSSDERSVEDVRADFRASLRWRYEADILRYPEGDHCGPVPLEAITAAGSVPTMASLGEDLQVVAIELFEAKLRIRELEARVSDLLAVQA